MGARFLTVGERSYRFGKGANENDLYSLELMLEVLM